MNSINGLFLAVLKQLCKKQESNGDFGVIKIICYCFFTVFTIFFYNCQVKYTGFVS